MKGCHMFNLNIYTQNPLPIEIITNCLRPEVYGKILGSLLAGRYTGSKM